MDMDFWASRVHAAKHLSALQAARINHSSVDDLEGDEDARAYFPCPFCYVEIEVQLLRSHLQEEHCFDFRNTVCPVCAANLGKDAIEHFTMQHSHSIKRGRKSAKSGFWSNSSKELRGVSSFLGSSSMSGRGGLHDSTPDPLLAPFIRNVPVSEPKGNQGDEGSINAASTTSDGTSTYSTRADELQEQDYGERRQRAAFFQQLILSTIF